MKRYEGRAFHACMYDQFASFLALLRTQTQSYHVRSRELYVTPCAISRRRLGNPPGLELVACAGVLGFLGIEHIFFSPHVFLILPVALGSKEIDIRSYLPYAFSQN